MGNVLLYTLLMAGITFAIGFFVAFIIKIVFSSIQRFSLIQTEEYKRGNKRAKRIQKIRKRNSYSVSQSWRLKDYYNNRIPINKEASIIDTNEIVEFYYGKS